MASEPAAKINPASEAQPGQINGTAQTKAAQPLPMGARGAIYTVTAAQGASAADMVNAGMIAKVVGKVTQRRIMVAPPDGPSTSGGKHARQTITLVPVSGQGAAIMCGWMDVAQKTASLRDYRAVSDHHKARTGKALDVTAEEYLSVIHDLEKLLKALKVELSHETSDPVQKAAVVAQNIQEPEEEEEEQTNPKLLIGIGAFVAVAAIVFVVMLLR
jgi:hypothetical protein